MLFQSENFPALMFKGWSPISFGAWAILLFGLFSVLSALGARAEAGRLQMPALRAVGGVVKGGVAKLVGGVGGLDRKSTRLNSSHGYISYAVFCLKKKNS